MAPKSNNYIHIDHNVDPPLIQSSRIKPKFYSNHHHHHHPNNSSCYMPLGRVTLTSTCIIAYASTRRNLKEKHNKSDKYIKL